MKANDMKKLIDDLTSIGYEILEMKPLPWSFDDNPRKTINGMYSIKILPIEKNKRAETSGKNNPDNPIS